MSYERDCDCDNCRITRMRKEIAAYEAAREAKSVAIEKTNQTNWQPGDPEPYKGSYAADTPRAAAADIARIDVGRKPIEDKQMETWAGGAKRSAKMPDWWMAPWKAIEGMLTRFTIGMKYGINNWKKVLDVPREQWHDGEPGPGKGIEDKSALGFVRQFYAHGNQHFVEAVKLADQPAGATSPKGDTLIENLYAYAWNALTMLEYAIENEDMWREAFSQYPLGSPRHRMDLGQQDKRRAE